MKLKTILSVCTVAALVAGCEKTDQSNTGTTPNAGATSNQVSYGSGAGANENKVDDTKVNVRDRDGSTLTPLSQGNSKPDIDLTASIRRMVDSSTNNFSTDAKNVKIITQNGKVTLRGPVNTEAEKTQIEAIAKGVAGDGNVQDDLEVKSSQ